MTAKARQEGGLRLPDDGAGDPNHHVVEAAVPEVVLDPRPAGPGGGAVDHVQLAVVGAANLVLAPVDALAVGEETVSVEREDVVDHDLRAGVGEPREHLARLLVRPRAVAVHDHPHLDALGQLAPEERGHLHPDLALTPAEHQDVHGRPRRLDVREDPREEARALDQRLDRRGGRPRERQRRIVRTGAAARDERLGRRLRARRGDRVGRRRPARPLRDPEHLPVHDDEDRREHEPGDRRGAPSLARREPVVASAPMSDPNARRDRAATWRLASRVAVAAVLVGVFVTWVADGPVRLDGTQGPNNGWLAVIMAALALLWIRMLGSWVGVIGVLGSGLVIFWTALENWLDARATIGASAAPGVVLVLAGSAVLTAAAVVRAVELARGALRHRAA